MFKKSFAFLLLLSSLHLGLSGCTKDENTVTNPGTSNQVESEAPKMEVEKTEARPSESAEVEDETVESEDEVEE